MYTKLLISFVELLSIYIDNTLIEKLKDNGIEEYDGFGLSENGGLVIGFYKSKITRLHAHHIDNVEEGNDR